MASAQTIEERVPIREGDYGKRVVAGEPGGVEYISLRERHGAPLDLFWTWMSPNLEFATVFVGTISVVLFGGSLWSVVAGLVVGSALGSLTHGILSSWGPRFGVPQMVQGRAAVGYWGNVLPAGHRDTRLLIEIFWKPSKVTRPNFPQSSACPQKRRLAVEGDLRSERSLGANRPIRGWPIIGRIAISYFALPAGRTQSAAPPLLEARKHIRSHEQRRANAPRSLGHLGIAWVMYLDLDRVRSRHARRQRQDDQCYNRNSRACGRR